MNNKNLRTFAGKLRNNSTFGEIKLWNEVLKNKKLYGLQWNRQFIIENYIVDFICRKCKLIIEIDGYSHNFKFEQDIARDLYLQTLGYTVIRFKEKDVVHKIDTVIAEIEMNVLQKIQSPLPPSPRGN